MRIVQVAPFFYPAAGGVESHVRAIADGLTRAGHEVTVVTSRFQEGLLMEQELDGYRVLRGRTWGVWFNTPVDPGVGSLLKTLDADVVHLHYPPPMTSYFATRALRRRRVPVCLTYHCDLYLSGAGGRLATGLYERIFLPPTLRRIDRIIVHTRSYGSTSSVLRGRPLEIIPSSVNTERFRRRDDAESVRALLKIEGKRVLAFTGRLVPHKGVDLLLRTLAELPSDVVLLVIGRGPRLQTLVSLARRLGVLDRVRFCPAVSDEDLPRYLSAADLFVFPSQNRLEGFGLVVAEAMAAALPVVITDMPGVREVIEPGKEGLLVEPLLAGDLAEKIRMLLNDPARRKAMGDAGRRRAEERYSTRAVVRQLIQLYEGLRVAG